MNTERISLHNDNGKNDRFRYEKFQQDGEWYFVKTARTSELEPNLKRELLWAEFLNHIAASEPEAHLRAPRIVGFDTYGGLIMEYIDAELVATPSDSAAWKAKISQYAYTLALLDEYAKGYKADWPQDSATNIHDPEGVWRRWYGEHYDDAQSILQNARSLLDEYRNILTFRVQHGDLTPWQIFELGNEWIIYDGEQAGDHLPRYNDLAYGYGRLYTKFKDPATATQLLADFLEYSQVDHGEFFEQFLPVMTFRATGMLADAYADRSSNNDYYEEAVKLINLCLEKKLSKFLPTSLS